MANSRDTHIAAPVQDDEIDAVTGIFRAYGNPLGVSGVLLGTAVVTERNERRVRVVMGEMQRRGLIRVKHAAFGPDHDDLYVLTEEAR